MWSFNLRDTIANLYAQKGYPKHAPNTVVPEYSCAQHSKYACVLDLILKRPEVPRTDVYAWMDFGYFRNLQDGKDYCLVLPKGFNRTKASFNQVGIVCLRVLAWVRQVCACKCGSMCVCECVCVCV